MGRLLVPRLQQRTNRGRVRATDAELKAIASGINHVVIMHDSQWSLQPGMGADRVYDVKFDRPVLKRPLTDNDKLVAQEWAKYHPRYWRVLLMLDMFDGEKWYTDSTELVTNDPLKLNELKEHVDLNWLELESRQNPKHIRGRRWEARIIKTHERKARVNADNQ